MMMDGRWPHLWRIIGEQVAKPAHGPVFLISAGERRRGTKYFSAKNIQKNDYQANLHNCKFGNTVM